MYTRYSILHGLAKGASSAKQIAQDAALQVQNFQRIVTSLYADEPQTAYSPEQKQLVSTPRILDLITPEQPGDESAPLNFFVFGCAGDGGDAQQQVANMINTVASQTAAPQFCVMLGDNFYDFGVDSADDPAFSQKFYDVYHQPEYPYIADLPYFVVLGNHDHNLHNNPGMKLGNINGNTDPNKIAAQVLHTYAKDKNNVYQSDKINMLDLPRWNMPSHYYLVRWKNVELFFVDSNTYVKDFLAMVDGDENNQAWWLQQHAKDPTTTKLLFMHHPLLTVGKRSYHPDTNVYLSQQDIEILKSQHNIEGGYNAILRQILTDKQGLVFDTVFSAHDHSLFYHLDRVDHQTRLCQLTIGGGGGKLQHRHTAKDWQLMPFNAKEHGFVSVTIAPHAVDKRVVFDFHYGLDFESYRQVRFDNLSLLPLKQFSNEDSNEYVNRQAEFIDKLREIFFISYTTYMNHAYNRSAGAADDPLNLGEYHGSKGLTSADSLRNMFNNFKPLDALEVVEAIRNTFGYRLTYATSTSLSTIFNDNLQRVHQHSLESLYESFLKQTSSSEQEMSQTVTLNTPYLTSSPFSFFSISQDGSPEFMGLGNRALPGGAQDSEERTLSRSISRSLLLRND